MIKKIVTLCFLLLVSIPCFAQVEVAWVARYNGGCMDVPMAMAMDDSGYIYVTGTIQQDCSNFDYGTIKYDPDGNQIWVKAYNGSGNMGDYATAIAIDGSRNVYITGRSYGDTAYNDYVTIKYDQNGNQIWIKEYNGPGNWKDEPWAISLDNSNNIYVTGTIRHGASSSDYATIKYDPSGNELWVQTYGTQGTVDIAYAMAVDYLGNVCVTGWSKGNNYYDYATIKYDSAGNELWVRRYDAGDDRASAIATDGSGNVYVTGSSGTIKYDTDGNQLWIGPWGGGDIEIDTSGNVYVTGSASEDYRTVKYYPDGDTAWLRMYNGPADSTDRPGAIAVDLSGNVYVTGYAWCGEPDSGGTHYDYITIKYDADGNQLRTKRYNGPANNDDGARTIVLDNSGNIYVTGWSRSEASFDYATIKYSPSLNPRGDPNGDGEVTISDVVYLINYLFNNGPAPVPLASADVNCDNEVDIIDAVYLVNYLFRSGPPPC